MTTLLDRAVKALKSLKSDGVLPDRYIQDASRNAEIDAIIKDYIAAGDGIGRQTIVEGWSAQEHGGERRPGARKVYNGHIDLQDAIREAGDVVLNTPGAYVKAYHHVELADPVSWSGNI